MVIDIIVEMTARRLIGNFKYEIPKVLVLVVLTSRNFTPKCTFLRELRHSLSDLLEVFLQFVCVDAHRDRRISVTEYLADQRDRYVLAQQITASIVSKVMPCQVRQSRFIEQGSEYPLLEVLIGVLVAFGCAEG